MCYSALVKRQAKELGLDFDALIRTDEVIEKNLPPDGGAFVQIFPGSYAPIVHEDEKAAQRWVEFMRYGTTPPAFIPEPKKYTTFNARRDNLNSKFWSTAFTVHHGIVVLKSFFEWVEVAKLLKGGVVTLAQVQKEFATQALKRKQKVEAQGKPYKPTKAETTDPRFRQIVIEFRPETQRELLVPVIFTVDGKNKGFAIITDEPPEDVSRAGHDRCPVFLNNAQAALWLKPEGKSAKLLDAILETRLTIPFRHDLAIAA